MYTRIPDLAGLVRQISLYTQLKDEYGARSPARILARAERGLKTALADIRKLPVDKEMVRREPNDLASIRRLRPRGLRRLWPGFREAEYRDKIEGALIGRMAGCTLGAPVEGWSIEKMEALARENDEKFPPTDYWRRVPEPFLRRYSLSPREAYTRDRMDGVPVDDDITYTLLGLLVVEEFGPGFTVQDNAKAWLKYLPYACTAEDVALRNLRAGVTARSAGEKNNPFCEWIGADIRSDPWGYMAPGWPERAADMAYRDAWLSHRRQGIYGEMFFSAAISAAFAVDHPVAALEIGLTEIPRACALAKAVRWALRVAPQIRNYREARAAVDERFKGMHQVHTINNACLTVWGLTIGGTDLTRVISETVAMGLDNDCTAATAGSIAGAVVGRGGISAHWSKRFNNTVHCYLIGNGVFKLNDLVRRFSDQAALVHGK